MTRILAWVGRHHHLLLLALVGIGVGLRALLVAGSPTPFGYVYDFYHEAIVLFHRTGTLPSSMDCYQCYHPPLFYWLGLPFFSLGMKLSDSPVEALRYVGALPLLCGAFTVFMSYRLFRLFRLRREEVVLGTALVLCFPCLFISSYGLEADIVLCAVMVTFLYVVAEYHVHARRVRAGRAVLLGVLCGLAIATKYSGLVSLPIAGVVLCLQWHRVPKGRRKVVANMAIVLALALFVGGWKYVDNQQHYGNPLFARGTAAEGFAVGARTWHWDRYDFASFDLPGLMESLHPDARLDSLTRLPVYRSVLTTLHAQAWGDMGFFTQPSRNLVTWGLYPPRGIPPSLVSAVLLLAIPLELLALAGIAATWRRKSLLPIWLPVPITLAVYFYWVVGQHEWALKLKYILFLLPAFVLYALFGLRWVRTRFGGVLHVVALSCVGLLILTLHLYLFYFAKGMRQPELDVVPRRALFFDGRGDAVAFSPSRGDPSSFTYELLVQRSSDGGGTGTEGALLLGERGGWGENRLELNPNGRVSFVFHDVDHRPWRAVSRHPLPAARWVHVAGVWNGASIALYLDGQLGAFQYVQPRERPGPPYYGRLGSDPGGRNAFRGSIDRARIWSRALSWREIQAVMGRDANAIEGEPDLDWRSVLSE